jgi:hypothetical protein
MGSAGLLKSCSRVLAAEGCSLVFWWMFGEKVGVARFFTKHPEEFCCLWQQKSTFEKP